MLIILVTTAFVIDARFLWLILTIYIFEGFVPDVVFFLYFFFVIHFSYFPIFLRLYYDHLRCFYIYITLKKSTLILTITYFPSLRWIDLFTINSNLKCLNINLIKRYISDQNKLRYFTQKLNFHSYWTFIRVKLPHS